MTAKQQDVRLLVCPYRGAEVGDVEEKMAYGLQRGYTIEGMSGGQDRVLIVMARNGDAPATAPVSVRLVAAGYRQQSQQPVEDLYNEGYRLVAMSGGEHTVLMALARGE